MKRVVRKIGAACLSFVMLFNANMPTVLIAEDVPQDSTPEPIEEEVKEQPAEEPVAKEPAVEEVASDHEEATVTEADASSEETPAEGTVQDSAGEGTDESDSESTVKEPVTEPDTEESTSQGKPGEETGEEQKEENTPASYRVIAVYQTNDGITLEETEEPLILAEEEQDTAEFAADFGESYTWSGNAYITAGEEMDSVIRLASDHYVTAEEETVLYADWFSPEEPVYVVYTYESMPAEAPMMFSALNAGSPLLAAADDGSTDLVGFLAGTPVIKHGETVAETDENGRTVINDSETYTIAFEFAEDSTSATKQLNMHEDLVYPFPAGFTPIEGGATHGIEHIVVEGEACDLTWNLVQRDGKYYLEYTWPSYDEIPEKVKNSTDIDFKISISGKIDSALEQIDFGGGKTVDLVHKNSSELLVEKTGSYVGADDKIHYQVTVTSKYGNSTNVHLEDTITGAALTFDGTAVVTEGSATITNLTPKDGNKGFSCDLGNLGKDEKVVIEYTADINYDAIDGSGTFETTGNTIKATSNEDTEGAEKANTVNNISYSSASKSAGTASDVDENGYRTIEWTATLNSEKKVGLNTISDSITSTDMPMYYDTSSPLIINGVEVPWSQVGVTSDTATSWTYTVPDSDGPIEYTVTYKTKVKVDSITDDKEVKNHIETDRGGKADGKGTVGPTGENTFGLAKSGELSEDNQYVDWTITVEVPAIGMDDCVVTDTLPSWYSQNTLYKDSLVGDVSVDFSSNPNNDKYSVTESTITDWQGVKDQIIVTFSKSNGSAGLSGTGEKRTITIRYRTQVNPDWVAAANRDMYDASGKTHTNTVSAHNKTVPASVTLGGDKSIRKNNVNNAMQAITIDGKETVAFEFEVVMSGVDLNGFDVEDEFDGSLFRVLTRAEYAGASADGKPGYFQNVLSHNGQMQNTNQPEITFDQDSGGVVFHVSKETIDAATPQGDYGGEYSFRYYMIAKDLDRLKELAAQNGGKYTFGNTASMDNVSSDNVQTSYQNGEHNLSKTMLNEGAVDDQKTIVGNFEIVVNPNARDLSPNSETLDVTDTFTNLSIDYDSIRVYEVNGSTETLCGSARWDVSGSNATFVVPDEKKLIIRYNATIIQKGKISNTATVAGEKQTYEHNVDFDVDSSGTGTNHRINVLKYADGDMTQRLDGVTFQLFHINAMDEDGNVTDYEPVNFTGSGKPAIKVTDENGEATFDDIAYLTNPQLYFLQETSTKQGYVLDNTKYIFSFANRGQSINYDQYIYANDDTVKVRNKPRTTLKLSKTVRPDNEATTGRSYKVTVKGPDSLYYDAEGKSYQEPVYVTITPGTETVINNIPVGKYTITEDLEDAKIEGYVLTAENGGVVTAELTLNDEDGTEATITNNYADSIDVTVVKEWKGGVDTERPDAVLVKLYQDGTYMPDKDISLKKSEGWTYTWRNLPAGHTYQVEEEPVSGFKVSYVPRKGLDNTGTVTITNTRVETRPGTTEIGVKKEWTGSSGSEITFNLKRKKLLSYTLTVLNEHNTVFETRNIPAGANGANVEFSYTGGSWTPGYAVISDGVTVAEQNSDYGQATTKTATFTATGNITIKLKSYNHNGTSYDELVTNNVLAAKPVINITPEGDTTPQDDTSFSEQHRLTAPSWSAIIQNLPTEEEGASYLYYVEEISVDGEPVSSDKVTYTNNGGITEGVITITNESENAKGKLKITKAFGSDSDLKDGDLTDAQKKAITFTITDSNNSEIGRVSYKDFENGSWLSGDLDEGDYTITETVDETAFEGYEWTAEYNPATKTVSVTKDNTAQAPAEMTVTNTYTEKTGSLKLEKILADGSPEDAASKEFKFAIKVKDSNPVMYVQEGGDLGKTKHQFTITGAGSLTLDKVPLGDYVVEEDQDAADIDYYSLAVSGTTNVTVTEGETASASITNTYTRDYGSLKVQKVVENAPESASGKTFKLLVVGEGSLYYLPDGTSTEDISKGYVTVSAPDYYAQWNNLPAGMYLVLEDTTDAEIPGYSLAPHGEVVVEVTKDNTETNPKETRITNTYTQKLSSVRVTKAFTGLNNLPSGFSITNDFNDSVFTVDNKTSGTGTESDPYVWEISNVPVGTTVTFTEQNIQAEGYNLSVNGTVTTESTASATAVSTENTVAAAKFVNAYTEKAATLTVSKTWKGDTIPDSAKTNLKIRITGPDIGGAGVNVLELTYSQLPYTSQILHEGNKYTVEELNAGELAADYELVTTESTTAVREIPITEDGAVANLINTYEVKKGALKITKSVTVDSKATDGTLADGTYSFTITGPENYSETKTITITGGKSNTVSVENLTPGNYTIKETTPTNGTSVVGNASVTVEVHPNTTADTTAAIAEFTNNLVTGSLKITKKITIDGKAPEGTDADGTYSFTITGPDNYSGTAEITVTNGVGTEAVIDGLKPGTYNVTEDQGAAGKTGYSLTVIGTGDVAVKAGETASAEVTNAYTKNVGSLKVKKVVSGLPEGESKTFRIAVKQGTTYYNPDGTTAADQKSAWVEFSAGNEKEWKNLPAGTYTIEEDEDFAEIDGYQLVVSYSGVAEVSTGSTASAEVTNTYTENTGSLKVSKTVKSDDKNDKTKSFKFKVTLDDKTVAGTFGDMTFKDGVAEFTLKDGESKTASGLLSGVKYTVEEKKADGFTVTKTGDTGTIKANATAEVTFTNTKGTPPTPTPTPTPGPKIDTRQVRVVKAWKDGDNAGGTRPASVTVHLLADGVDTGLTVQLSAANNWNYVWYNLPVYTSYGNIISYSVAEDPVPGYTAEYSGSMNGGYTITNKKRVIPKTDDTFEALKLQTVLLGSMLMAMISSFLLRKTAER